MLTVGLDVSGVNGSGTLGHMRPPTATTTACVTASTGINSLSVALGSTFGAFLALGVIVAFVLIAKYQYIRRKRKSIQIQLLQRCDDSFESLPAAADAVTGNEDDEDATERPTVNGTIELKRLSRQPTLGRVPDDDDQDGDAAAAVDEAVGGDNDSRCSDFSADIILHDTVVQATTSGYPVSLQSQRPDAADGGDPDVPQRLVLDSATCAGSFILANDEPTGRTYSLLVPITSPAVQPLLAGSEVQAGGPRLLRISGGGAAGSGEAGGGKSIVRLKLRKHATVDYSSVEEEDGRQIPLSAPRDSVVAATEGEGLRTLDAAAARAGRHGTVKHRVSVCCGRQDNPCSTTQPQQSSVHEKTSSTDRRVTRSLSSDW